MLSKRLKKERTQLIANEDRSINLKCMDDNIREWKATIIGPPGSYYEGYEYDLIIHVPVDYPMVPPVISFKSKIFHPNVLYEVTLTLYEIVNRKLQFFIRFCLQCRMVKFVLIF